MERTFRITTLSLILLLSSSLSLAAQTFTVQGRLLNSNGSAITSSSVQFRIQVKSPGAEDCLLYQETQTLDLSQTQGAFALTVGQGTRAASTIDGGNALNLVFSNSSAISLTSATLPCGSGATSYTPAVSDTRKLNLSFDEGTGWDTIPTITLSWVPQAMHAQNADSLGGVNSTQFLKVASGTTPSALSGAAYTELLALLAGTSTQYVTPGSSLSTAGNISQTGTGTISTGTGAVSLNGATTIAANKNFSMASGTGTFSQTYTGTSTANSLVADSVTASPAQSISANGLTTGSILSLTSNSTSAAAGNKGLDISISGANSNAGITRTGLSSAVTSTGATSTNVAGYFSASGATNNYGLIVPNGHIGVGTTAPVSRLHIADDNTTSANYGVVSIGAGPFDGTTAGKFTGYASGTELAVNAASGFAGALLDLQTNGTTKFRVTGSGVVESGSTYATALFSSSGIFGTSSPNTAITIQNRDFSAATTGITMIPGTISNTSGQFTPVAIKPIYNQTSGTASNTDFLINRTQTAVGSGTQLLMDAQVSGVTKFNITNAGNGYFAGSVGIGTAPSTKLHVVGAAASTVATFSDGTATCTITPATAGNISCSSDRRLKRDISSVSESWSLNKILELDTVTYRWVNSEKVHTGYIAQEIEKVLPEFVSEDDQGYKKVSYVGLIPLITAAIKAVNERFENLKELLTSTNDEIESLKAQVEELKNENREMKMSLCKKDRSYSFCH